MSDVTADLRWTHFQPSAQAGSHHDCSTLTVGKTQALTVCGRWHLVRENAICIRHKPICLQRIGVSAYMCSCESDGVWVCVDAAEKTERGESQWDGWALGWHTVRQTHFITGLFTWLTGLLYQLHSTLQPTTVSNTPGFLKAPTPTHGAQTKASLPGWRFEWLTSSLNGGSAHDSSSPGGVSAWHQIYFPVVLN